MSRHSAAVRTAHALGFRVREDGVCVSPTGAVRKPNVQPSRGYGMVTFKVDGTWERFNIHRLAAFQWFGEAALGPGVVVRHLDANRTNNARSNIAIGSQSDNMMDCPAEQRRRVALAGAKARRSLADEQALDLVRLRRDEGLSLRVLGERFGLNKGQVSEILSGKLYSDVTGIPQKPRTRNAVPAHPPLEGGSC